MEGRAGVQPGQTLKLSDLQSRFAGSEATLAEYSVLLVDLDLVPSDGVDVIISPLREVEVDAANGEVRLYSASVRPEYAGAPATLFEIFNDALPMPGVHEVEFDVKIHLPIAPEDEGEPSLLHPLADVWIGRESEEIWLLVRPRSEYPEDLLPT